jgi:ubiquinone biosynthesis protein
MDMTGSMDVHDDARRVLVWANWRVTLVRFVVGGLLVAIVVALLPSVSADLEAPLRAILIVALVYALLDAYVRPVLSVLLIPFVVQSYGLALVAVDVLLFTLLLLFSGSLLQVVDDPLVGSGLLPILVGGLVLGILKLTAEALLGLTPPVPPEPPPPTSAARMRGFGSGLDERIRLHHVYDMIWIAGIDAALDREGIVARTRWRLQQWLWRPATPPGHIPSPVRFRLMLQQLGPTYVKIGQIISSQGRALPAEWEHELEKLQSDVAPFPYEDVRDRIIADFGAPPEDLYDSFEETPLAAASLAQVHRATLLDGRRVVVKVQRPNIHQQLRSDVRILVRMSRALEPRARWAEDVDLSGVLLEFGSTLLRELDYTIEAYNARRLARVLEPIEGLHVPDIVYELSSSRVITLEFIDGVKPTRAAEIDAAGLDREALAVRMIQGAVKMMMIDGFFHGDPHPGNVFVELASGRLTLLDTGMVGELTLQQRIKLGSLLLVIRNRDVTGMAQTLRSLSTPFRETDDARFYKDFERKLTPYLDPPPGGRVEVASKVLPASMELLRESGYRLDPQLTLAIKAMMQAEAITNALVPEWTGSEFMERSVDAAKELLPDVVTSDAVKSVAMKQGSYVLREAAQQMPSFQEGILKWMANLKRGGLKVELDTSGLNVQVDRLRGIATLVTIGIILVGLVIGSAIAASVGTAIDSPLGSLQDFALVVFAGSSIAASLMVIYLGWRLARRDRGSQKRKSLDRI